MSGIIGKGKGKSGILGEISRGIKDRSVPSIWAGYSSPWWDYSYQIESTGRHFHQTNDATAGSAHNFMCRETATEGGDELIRAEWGYDSDVDTSAWYIRCRDGNGYVGGIKSAGSSSISFETSSDYRLKENVVELGNGLARILALRPVRYNMIGTSETNIQDGFIAHEVVEASSDNNFLCSKEKDKVNNAILYTDKDDIPEGQKVGDVKTAEEIDPQSLDYGRFTPMIVKSIQELSAKNDALEARLKKMEAE